MQEKNGGSLSTNAEPSSGTKDPTKSVTCDAKLKKKGEKAPSTGSDASKKAVVAKTAKILQFDIALCIDESFLLH